jgi:hypothetical protein
VYDEEGGCCGEVEGVWEGGGCVWDEDVGGCCRGCCWGVVRCEKEGVMHEVWRLEAGAREGGQMCIGVLLTVLLH